MSRGGVKLEYALNKFNILLTDRVAMDIGASTGGFTDCLLQHGIDKVFAVVLKKGQITTRDYHNIDYIQKHALPTSCSVSPLFFCNIIINFFSYR